MPLLFLTPQEDIGPGDPDPPPEPPPFTPGSIANRLAGMPEILKQPVRYGLQLRDVE